LNLGEKRYFVRDTASQSTNDYTFQVLGRAWPLLATSMLMTEQSDDSAASNASQCLSAVLCSKFIVSLCVRARFSTLFLPISKTLQSPQIDLIQCPNKISSVQQILRDCRENACEEFKKIFETAEKLSSFPLPVPRKVGRKILRANYESHDAETYYRQAVYVP